MRKKKEPKIKKPAEEETAEEKTTEETLSEPQKDIKLGEFILREGSVLVIKKTNYKGEDRIDFRVWLNTPSYKGPTKQGFVLTMDKIDDFISMVAEFKKKLSE